MAFSFDGRSFGQVLDDVEDIVRDARDLERRLADLTELIGAIERNRTAGGLSPVLIEVVRAICSDARIHRQRAESLVAHLAGDSAQTNGSSRRHRVLIVDDAEDNRELVSFVLENAGYKTLTASDGLEGVIVAHYSRPDLIVMDVTMPVMTGIEAARLLKASAATQDVNLIAYTARPDFEELPFTQLFVDVLKKPAAPPAILASVKRFIGPEKPPDR